MRQDMKRAIAAARRYVKQDEKVSKRYERELQRFFSDFETYDGFDVDGKTNCLIRMEQKLSECNAEFEAVARLVDCNEQEWNYDFGEAGFDLSVWNYRLVTQCIEASISKTQMGLAA